MRTQDAASPKKRCRVLSSTKYKTTREILKRILMTQEENAAALQSNSTKMDEILRKIQVLILSQGTGDVQPELQNQIDATISKTHEIEDKLAAIP